MHEHADVAGGQESPRRELSHRRNIVETYRETWFVRIFQPTLDTLIQHPATLSTFFYFCARLQREAEPKRPVEWLRATRAELAEATKPDKTRPGPKRRARDPAQTVSKHLKACLDLKLLVRNPKEVTEYQIPATVAQFGNTDDEQPRERFVCVRGAFLREMERVWLHSPHALRVITIMLRRVADRPGRGHCWFHASEADWMTGSRIVPKKTDHTTETPTRVGDEDESPGAKGRMISPQLLRPALESLKNFGTFKVKKDGEKIYYQIPLEYAGAVGLKADRSFDPLRKKPLIRKI
jgi:hypothetical protein